MSIQIEKWDVAIIGGAAAGLAAALFASRRDLKTVIMTKDIGGQLASTIDVENYPGIDYIEGYKLANEMAEQARKYGTEIILDEVTNIKALDGEFTIAGKRQSISARSVIIAHGKTPRSLNVPGETELFSKGVGHAASIEVPKYPDQPIVIVGGGSAAFEAVRIALKTASQVYLVHRNQNLRAEAHVVDQVKNNPDLVMMLDSEVVRINGTDKVESVEVKKADGETETLEAAAVLIEIGFEIKRGFLNELLELDKLNRIVTNERGETSRPGIFAAGDITNKPYNQIAVSVGEGATAALSAYTYLTGKPAGSDWGKN